MAKAITAIDIKNLKSIKDQRIELAPITVLYGPNGSGKSTLMNALAILRNIVLNPNQSIDSFFNLRYINLGGFEQVVFDHDLRREMVLATEVMNDSSRVTYRVALSKEKGRLSIQMEKPWKVKLEIETTFPYTLNQKRKDTLHINESTFTLVWDGVVAQVVVEKALSEKDQEYANRLATLLNSPAEILKSCDFVSLRRGFSKPIYSTVSLSPVIYTEDEVATVLANNLYLQDKVSRFLERIMDHQFRVHVPPGTTSLRLNTIDRATDLSTDLVNNGFGINQVVYLLAKSLRKESSTICIEEPEIHLHPKALRNLVHAFIKMIKEEDKTIIISTHSESLLSALLGAVAQKKLKPDEVACYLCTKEGKESVFKRQLVNEKGQVEGGLTSFMEGELEDLMGILGVKKR